MNKPLTAKELEVLSLNNLKIVQQAHSDGLYLLIPVDIEKPSVSFGIRLKQFSSPQEAYDTVLEGLKENKTQIPFTEEIESVFHAK